MQARVPEEDLELVSWALAVLVSSKGFPVVAVRRLLEKLRMRLVSRVQVGDQGGTPAIRTGQLAVRAVDPVVVVLAQVRKGLVHAQPHWAIDGAEAGQSAARSEAGGDWIPGGKLTSGVAGTRTSGGGGGGELHEIQGAGTRLLL